MKKERLLLFSLFLFLSLWACARHRDRLWDAAPTGSYRLGRLLLIQGSWRNAYYPSGSDFITALLNERAWGFPFGKVELKK